MAKLPKNIAQQLQKIIERELNPRARTNFNETKRFILDRVKNHGVCRELKDPHKPSSYLGSSDGTLFGFMGFNDGDTPVADLLEFLEDNITQDLRPLKTGFGILKRLKLPSKADMRNSNLKLPWLSSVSWPEAVEDGISGLRYFLKFPDNEGVAAPPESRSQEGLQAKTKGGGRKQVRPDDAQPIDFLSEIFSQAKKLYTE